MAISTSNSLSQPNLESYEHANNPIDHQKVVPHDSIGPVIETLIGDKFSWSLFLQATLVAFTWFFDAQQIFISIFTDDEPSWHCTTNQLKQANNETCTSTSNICKLSSEIWAWNHSAEASTVSEFGLHCYNLVVRGMPASAFFLGSFLGGLTLMTLADSLLGRKKMLIISCLGMSIFSFLTAFSTNLWMYSALRFVSGIGRSPIRSCALVLPTELVGKKWRGQVAMLCLLSETLGFLSLPAMGYLNRNHSWRNLYIWTSVPPVIYCVAIFFFASESPRWLFVRGRKGEAMETLKKLAQNPDNVVEMFSNLSLDQQEASITSLFSTIKILVTKTWALKRLLLTMGISFGVGMVANGAPLALGNMDLNLYMSVTFNALSELPSALITSYLVAKVNRKTSILATSIFSGFFSVMSAVKWGSDSSKWLQIGFELLSFSSVIVTAGLKHVLAVELFPTCVRNSAVSIIRQAMTFGGVVAALLAAASRGGNGMVSYGVFGVVLGLSGFLVLLLPETRGKTLCDTIDDEERKLEAAKYKNRNVC